MEDILTDAGESGHSMLRTLSLQELVDYLVLLFCLFILIFSLPGQGSIHVYGAAALYVIIPGYAFARVFLPPMHLFERAVAMVGFSLASSTFVVALVDVFLGETGISAVIVMDALCAMLIASAIIRNQRRR